MTPSEFIATLNRPLAELPHELAMVPLPGPFNVEIRPPGSKSLTNRALLLAALAEGESVITGALIDADDAQVMIEALRQLGAGIELIEESSLRIRGTAGCLRGDCTLNLKNAGTATRFLTAAACLADGPVVIDGNERMRRRPIGELVAMLRRLGVTIDELGEPGCVPLRVHPAKFAADFVDVGSTQSSQFISALMLIAPFTERGLTFRFGSEPTSPSYMQMSVLMLFRVCGVEIDGEISYGNEITIPSYRVTAFQYSVEPDASSATYFWAAGALIEHADTMVWGLGMNSLQGDAAFGDILRTAGAGGNICCDDDLVEGRATLLPINSDFTNMPDAAMTLAAVACFAEGTTTITGLRTLRVKETDRLAAMQTELSKLGVRVEIFQVPSDKGGPPDEGIRITPPAGGIDCSPSAPRIVFDTYDDHRMAMSLALIGLRRPNVVIRDPACVAKTYPTFWAHLSLLYLSAISGGALTRSV